MKNDRQDIRIVNTADLEWLNRTAVKYHLNRTIGNNILGRLDPEGNHVLSLVLYGHNMDQSDVLHHRVKVLAKIKGDRNPVFSYLDVRDDDWGRLNTVDAARTQLGLSVGTE